MEINKDKVNRQIENMKCIYLQGLNQIKVLIYQQQKYL